MNRKNKLIIGLLAAAVGLYCFIQFCILPLNQAKKEDYMRSQTDALTHDISAVENYRTPYIGNANNVAGLFENLPLNNISRKFEINSDDCALTVNYLDTIWNIGEQKGCSPSCCPCRKTGTTPPKVLSKSVMRARTASTSP